MYKTKKISIMLIIILLIVPIIISKEVVAIGKFNNIAQEENKEIVFTKLNSILKIVNEYFNDLEAVILQNEITNKNYTDAEEIAVVAETVKKPELKVSNKTRGSEGSVILAGETAIIEIEVSGENIEFDTNKIKVRKKNEISMSGDPVKDNGNGGAELKDVTIERDKNKVIIKMQTFEDSEKLGYIIIDINEGFARDGKENNEFLRKTYYVASLHETARKNDNTNKIDLTAMVGVHNSFYVKDYKFSIIKGENKLKEGKDNWTTNEYTFTDLELGSNIENKVEVEINFYIDKNDTTYVRKGKIWETIDASENKINLKKELEVHFIDMSLEDGTGDCIFVRIPDGENYKTMLIDAGNNDIDSANHINQYLIENGYVDINEENIAKIDYLIMTHSHGDHIGGLLKLTGLRWKSDEQKEYKRVKTGLDYGNIYYDFDNIIVGCDYEYNYEKNSTYKLLIDYAKQEKNFIQLTAGNVLEIGDIIINIFNPYPAEVLPLEWLGDYNKMLEEKAEDKTPPEYFRDKDWGGVRRLAQTAENNRSIVTKLCYGGKRILLTGDIVFYTEEVLTGKIAEEIKEKKGLIIDEIINIKDSESAYRGTDEFTESVIEKNDKGSYYLNDTNKIAVKSTEINLVKELLKKYNTESYNTLESKYKLSRFTKKDLSADILKKGHHSTFNSSSIEFLENVNPDKIVVTGNDRSNVINENKKLLFDPTLTSLYYQPAYRIAKYYQKRGENLDNIVSYILSTTPNEKTDSFFNCIYISTGGKSANFSVTVVENTVSKIEIVSKPSKVKYYVGDTLDTSGLKVKATYVNGTSKEITSGFICTPKELNTIGSQEITVTYGGKSVNFSVTVVENTLSKIEIVSKPSKVKYYVGDTLDTSGLKIKATYANGTSKEITSGFTCSPTKLNIVGSQEITVTYGGKTAKFNVEVLVKELEELKISISDRTKYEIEDIYIYSMNPKTTKEDMLKNIITNAAVIEIYKGEEKITEDTAKIGTGMTIRLSKGTEIKEYTLIVIGDCNGSGTTNVADLTRLMMSRAEELAQKKDETKILKGCYRKAIDFNKDNKINISDITNLCMFIANNK